MPVVYRCKNCGYTLWVFLYGNSRGVPTPSEVAYAYGGRCPRCGSPLGVKVNGPKGLLLPRKITIRVGNRNGNVESDEIVVTTIKLPKTLVRELDRLSSELMAPRSEIIRWALIEFIARREKHNEKEEENGEEASEGCEIVLELKRRCKEKSS